MDIYNAYSYYRTIPVLSEWRIEVPDNYKTFFPTGEHLNFEEFQKLYESNKDFQQFIDEQYFRKIIENYIATNMTFYIYPDNLPHGLGSGSYTIQCRWLHTITPFLIRTYYLNIN